MIKVEFYKKEEINEKDIKYVVINAFYKEQIVVVRHKDRTTWEIPAGHKEENETSLEAAKRELFEETGAKAFELKFICTYSVNKGENKSYGDLYYADIIELGKLPGYEIEELKLVKELPENLTYPLIQPLLSKRVNKFLGS
ncbi:MAG: NUDIX hydrolase [Bacillota bacterium]